MRSSTAGPRPRRHTSRTRRRPTRPSGTAGSTPATSGTSTPVTAVVVAKPGEQIDEQAVIAAVKGVIDPYKAPKSVIVVTELPRTSTGKIQKNLVRDTFRHHCSP